ncbi:FCF1 [Candida oxycetoniae]|uniref:FCF1 n=1 Tax=Candida oxycetoniae TaxID=497107 RepID=A0AAI9SUT8_9ASCO|nr:FCF1 [Candida oxycetoniae]KAI3403286.2 FCF1 [Candida oxycetoniae]
MGKAKKTRKFAAVKRTLSQKDPRLSKKQNQNQKSSINSFSSKKDDDLELTKHIPQVSSGLFFKFNEAIRPPYQVLIDTNFINFSIQKKIDIIRGLMDCLMAKCIPIITDCVMAELEKLGSKYRIALKLAKDPRIQRLSCSHSGTYADDCLVNRVMQHKCYIVATNDADLKRRIRKVPGVPLLSVGSHSYVVERLPDKRSLSRLRNGAGIGNGHVTTDLPNSVEPIPPHEFHESIIQKLRNLLQKLDQFRNIPIPASYQISLSSNRPSISTLDYNNYKGNNSSIPHQDGCILTNEYYTLLCQYNKVYELLIQKNNEMNIFKYSMNEGILMIMSDIEMDAAKRIKRGSVTLMKKHNKEGKRKRVDEAGGCTAGPVDDSNVNAINEISKKLMDIFNPEEEFESTICSSILD